MLEAQGTVICANASIQLNQQLIPELTITTNCPVCDKKYFVLLLEGYHSHLFPNTGRYLYSLYLLPQKLRDMLRANYRDILGDITS